MPPPKSEKELQSFMDILNCISKFSPLTTEVCESPQKLKSVKIDWTRNKCTKALWQSKEDSQKDTCVEFYDTARPLYLEIDASGVSLGARLLKVRDGMNYGHDEVPDNATLQQIAFTSKSLLRTEWYYSSVECEALWFLHRLERMNLYC